MTHSHEDFRPLNASGILSWVHLGDLHLTAECEQNYHDFAIIAEANAHLADKDRVNFAVLPGDNADNGCEASCAAR
jgi:hypothetical protein